MKRIDKMDLSRFDLNLLLAFSTIYQEGSLTRAAARLHLSQPALSHALNRLREQLNDPLFSRQGNRMAPSLRAEQLIVPIRSALALLESSLQAPQRFEPRHAQREFRLGLRDVLEASLLPRLINTLQTEAPGIRLSCVQADRRQLENELSHGRLDLAMDVLLPVTDEIRCQPVSHDRLIVVAAESHPAVRKGKIRLEDYLAAGHVLVSSRRKGPGLEDMELSRAGLERQIVLRCQHYFAACRAVENSGLLLTMPEQYARLANTGLKNQLLPTPFSSPRLDVYLYWHQSRNGEAENRWLRETLASTLQAIALENH